MITGLRKRSGLPPPMLLQTSDFAFETYGRGRLKGSDYRVGIDGIVPAV